MKSKLFRYLLALFVVAAFSSQARATTVAWNGPADIQAGSMSMTFSPFVSNELTSVTFFSNISFFGPYFHDGVGNAYIDLYDGSNWVNIYTKIFPPNDLTNYFLTGLTPISFSTMTVSGIRFSSSDSITHFHNFANPASCSDCFTNFNFNDVAATPLPAALPLFAGGIGLIGLLARRRKRKALAA